MNTSFVALPGEHRYKITATLVDTQRRAQQDQEGRGQLVWTTRNETDFATWLRDWQCAWQRVEFAHGNSTHSVMITGPPADEEPICDRDSLSRSASYVALPLGAPCGNLCVGDATRRLFNTTNARRLKRRLDLGYSHVLKPRGCRLRLYENDDWTKCLNGRMLLSVGSSISGDIHRGFAKLVDELAACTYGPLAGDNSRSWWHWNFERTGFPHPDVIFGRGRVRSKYMHQPYHYGLANILTAEEFNSTETAMCESDIVVLESAAHDFGIPYTANNSANRRQTGKPELQLACGGQSAADCGTEFLLPRLLGEEWRLAPLATYRSRLGAVLDMWERCRSKNSRFRGIFKLPYAPRPRGISEGLRGGLRCDGLQFGYNTQAHHMAVVADLAKEMVEARGFETFDAAFAATLHADPAWYNQLVNDDLGKAPSPYNERDIQHIDATSDMVTQLLINYICSSPQ